jgi:hypothetical protein
MRLELKVCERCGALWLRPEDRRWIYCAGCLPVMNAMVRKPAREAAKAGAQ